MVSVDESRKYFCNSMQGYISSAASIFRKGGRVIEEELLISQIRQGNQEAFRQFVNVYGPYIYRMAYSVLHDAKEAEDTAQETFLQVYKSLPTYRSQGFKTWITRICVNKAIDCKRRRVRRNEEQWESEEQLKQMPSSDEDALTRLVRTERTQIIADRINELPDSHREIITSFYLNEQSYEQIAADQGIAIKTVESRLYRARQWMKAHWKEEDWS